MQIPDKLIELLLNSDNIALLSGAGVSKESGVQTFRDPDGLWARFNPSELASMDGFMKNPELVWEWYNHRRKIIGGTGPNPGHHAIAELERMYKKFTLITQNVDRLHQQAGSRHVYELHGNIIDNHCIDCKSEFGDDINLEEKKPPICKACGGKIRPSVVWFGEFLPMDQFSGAENAARNCDVFFVVGTSGEVYPAANLPLIAKDSGAVLVEVNPGETLLTPYMDFSIRGTSAQVMPEIVELIKKSREN